MQQNINKEQLIKMYEIIDDLNNQNEKITSHEKNEGLECFYDKNNNVMIRYCHLSYGDGGLIMDHVYKVITPKGEVKDGKEIFKNDAEAHGWTKNLTSIDIQDLKV